MWYIYILRGKKDNKLYTGCTDNLIERVRLHNTGKIESTKLRRPFILIHYEAYINRYDAYAREKWLKTGWGRKHLRKILTNTLKNLDGSSSRPPKFL